MPGFEFAWRDYNGLSELVYVLPTLGDLER